MKNYPETLFERTLFSTFIITVVVFLGFSFFNLNVYVAQATPGMTPFGGYIIRLDPGSPLPAFCPPHIQIYDFVTHISYGVMTGPGSKIYRYGNLILPGVYVLGEHVILPVPCSRPYPLYPIFQVGTGAF